MCRGLVKIIISRIIIGEVNGLPEVDIIIATT